MRILELHQHVDLFLIVPQKAQTNSAVDGSGQQQVAVDTSGQE